jgi:hypothetical protein
MVALEICITVTLVDNSVLDLDEPRLHHVLLML